MSGVENNRHITLKSELLILTLREYECAKLKLKELPAPPSEEYRYL